MVMNKLIILSFVLLSGCSLLAEKPAAEKVVYVTAPLQLPERPILPSWKGSDMECLSPEMKVKLRERDLGRKQYCEKLEVIIKSTQK
jgi:hypothetical protein